MGQALLKEMAIPIDGMSCSGCASTVERALRNLPGVASAAVELPKKQAKIVYDANQVDLVEFQNTVEIVGYSIPTTELQLKVDGMTCVSCAMHVGGALEELSGVLSAEVNLTKGIARVTFVPDLVSIFDMAEAIRNVGYQCSEPLGSQSTDEPPAQLAQADEQPVFTTARFGRFKKPLGRG